LRLDFEKGPIHPSPLGPLILTVEESTPPRSQSAVC
jgi:hypothetical protein